MLTFLMTSSFQSNHFQVRLASPLSGEASQNVISPESWTEVRSHDVKCIRA